MARKATKKTGKSKTAERAAEATKKVIAAFESGSVAAAMAKSRFTKIGKPMEKWSPLNLLIAMQDRCVDARTYLDWQRVGRQVIRGKHADTYIRTPWSYKDKAKSDAAGEDVWVMGGCNYSARFDVSSTEPIPDFDGEPYCPAEYKKTIDALPLKAVADQWGVAVEAYNPAFSGTIGVARGGRFVGLGSDSTETWFHELVHIAEQKMGVLGRGKPQVHLEVEAVAELGACILQTLVLGEDVSDASYSYIKMQVKDHNEMVEEAGAGKKTTLMTTIKTVLERTMAAVDYILDEAEALGLVESFFNVETAVVEETAV